MFGGAPQEILDQVRQDPEKTFLIWPENERAVNLFVRVSTQWSVAGMGGFVGLRYESVSFMLKLYYSDLKNDEIKTLFEELQIMEFAALSVLNEGLKK